MASKILLAEDDSNMRETLAEVLRAEGWEVITVPNGQAAMDALDEPDAAQCIVLDALLPKVNGFDVAKFVRGRGLETPILFISGVFKSPEQQKEAKDKYGCRAYLTKPFDAKRLVDAIKAQIGGGAGAAAGGGGSSPEAAQSPLPAEGTLLESPVLYLLWRAAREGHTGVLEVFGERERVRVFVLKGRGALAQHSNPQLNVGVELVREGVLSAESYVQACELALQRGCGLLDVLKAEHGCTDQQARAGYKALIPKVLEHAVAMSGRFRWVQTDQFANTVPTSSVSMIEPLFAGLRKASERDLDPHVGPRRPLRLAPGDNWADVVGKLAEACGSESLTRAINGRATIAQMIEAAPNPVERAARFRQVYLLMSTMAVRASLEAIPMGAQPPVPDRPAPQAPRRDTPPPVAPPRPSPQAQQPTPTPQPQPQAHAQGSQPPRATAQVGGRAAPQRPAIDESADEGVRFSPEEQEARARIAAKFEELVGKEFFVILGVKRNADAATIKKAYFALAKEFHTDAFAGLNLGAVQKKLDHVFQTIQTAHATLTDPAKRGEYEARLSYEETGGSSDVGAILQAETDLHKAKLLVDRGELGSALKVLEKVVLVMPKNDEVLGYQRYCTWYQTKSAATAQETVRALEQHWKAAPGALTLKEFQGWIWMEIGELKAARMAFKKVLELDPKHAGATRGARQLQRKLEEEEKKSSSGLSKFLKR